MKDLNRVFKHYQQQVSGKHSLHPHSVQEQGNDADPEEPASFDEIAQRVLIPAMEWARDIASGNHYASEIHVHCQDESGTRNIESVEFHLLPVQHVTMKKGFTNLNHLRISHDPDHDGLRIDRSFMKQHRHEEQGESWISCEDLTRDRVQDIIADFIEVVLANQLNNESDPSLASF
ncbi:hypothetical protein GCM10010082_17640 [Kushneria pakistanensis]|uniref:Uncharacterized protein n=1 Tax=Kushneria pakistanensis TaxID=1508770 RepID=A0ABQ3FI22_9GAMM|nr:hypothetical protein [Kushneria pakistanensis]GHC25263.1 hypothetical protein GCM10010082_17640 [Kushneria pakistanensis]